MQSKYRKIYVLSPFNYATGGVELAHQLVDYLREKNADAFIVYMKGWEISSEQDITKEYLKYNIKTCSSIEDSQENMLILPEIYYGQINNYKAIQIGCWWMSVDNHYKLSNCSYYDKFRFERRTTKKIKYLFNHLFRIKSSEKYSNRILKTEENRITHFYQSHYAQYHLYSKGYSKVIPLSDYINTELIGKPNSQKENIILYNPAKGYKYTQSLIKRMPQYKFFALKGLDRNQLKDLFQKAKLYIDFGHFPGKDRLFREAAINGCCIITGKSGAAFFYEDVPINEEYKYDAKKSNITNIKRKIQFVFNNYTKCYNDFEYLRKQIIQEKNVFQKEIDNIFFI